MTEDGIETAEQEINPQQEAEYWASKGVSSATEFFAKRADLDYVATDKLLLQANLAKAERLNAVGNIQMKVANAAATGERSANMFDNSDAELRNAMRSLEIGRGTEGGAGNFVRFSLIATREQIKALTNETRLKEQAATKIADFLQQSLKKQETPLPHIPPAK